MKNLILFVLAVALLCCIPCSAEARCGLFGWTPLQNIAARRAEGRGIGQRNGPDKRLVRGER